MAILVADGFEQVEMTKPREALDDAGTETKIVLLKSGLRKHAESLWPQESRPRRSGATTGRMSARASCVGVFRKRPTIILP